MSVYDMLAEMAPVQGVAGNVDGDGNGKTTEARALAAFADEQVDP